VNSQYNNNINVVVRIDYAKIVARMEDIVNTHHYYIDAMKKEYHTV